MSLSSGTRLGPYEVVAQIGAGGMGVVYRARDMRLGRDVAIKVLPPAFAEDADRLRRFEVEARTTGSLNHPNIVAVHDIGTHNGAPYLVMELLEGETLRDKLGGKPLPSRRSVEITLQIAHGLAAAHEKGIIHRDLKPENIFLTKDGRVKILDFGLAKLHRVKPVPGLGSLQTLADQITGPGRAAAALNSEPGSVMGTAGYMSPEQISGEKLDGRSDLFALGVILWEMLTGKRPFQGSSPIDMLHAILREEPPELDADLKLPPLLERVLLSCLAKDPSGRFHSAHDLAFALEATTGSGFTTAQLSQLRRGRAYGWRKLVVAALAGALAVLAALCFAWIMGWPPFEARPQPSFTRLTFAPGTVESALFGADGRTVYYSARIQGQKPEIFSLAPGHTEPRQLGAVNALLLSVSATDELAILREPRRHGSANTGTLARMPGGGGGVRDVLEQVRDAAWDSAGQALALLVNDRMDVRVEFPPGKILYTIKQAGGKLLRISRSQDRMAFVEGTGESTKITLYERGGPPRTLFEKPGDSLGDSITGLAWQPDGETLWFSEAQSGQTAFWALSMKGQRHLVWRGAGSFQLLDISPTGQVLAASHLARRGTLFQRKNDLALRDLSILDATAALDISANGKTLLLQESPSEQGSLANDMTYLRGTDGSPAVRLAQGSPASLSPDGRWVAIEDRSAKKVALTFVPTGVGTNLVIPLPGLESAGWAFFLPGGERLLFFGNEKGKDNRFFTVAMSGGQPTPVSPEGVNGVLGLKPLSTDGKAVVALAPEAASKFAIYDLAGGAPRSIPGLQANEVVIRWNADSRAVYAFDRDVLPALVVRIDLATGRRELWTSFMPPDRAGLNGIHSIVMTPDGSAAAFNYHRKLSELYLIEGLR